MLKNHTNRKSETRAGRTSAASVSAGLLALAALAGGAPSASAQAYGWIIDVAEPTLGPVGSGFPQETEITVLATFDDTVDYAMGAGDFDLLASEAGTAGVNWHSNALLAPLDYIPVDAGTLSATGAAGMKPGQLHFPTAGVVADPANPAPAWRITYTATDFTSRSIDLNTLTRQFRVYDDALVSTSRAIALASLVEGSGRINIVPAPASLALLGLAGMCVAFRRR